MGTHSSAVRPTGAKCQFSPVEAPTRVQIPTRALLFGIGVSLKAIRINHEQ